MPSPDLARARRAMSVLAGSCLFAAAMVAIVVTVNLLGL